MAESGYGITLNKKYYFEVKFTPRRYLRSLGYNSYEALMNDLPQIFTAIKAEDKAKKFKYRETDRLGFYSDANKLLAFTSAIPNDKTENDFKNDINDFINNIPSDYVNTITLLRDESKKAIRVNDVISFLSEIEKLKLNKGSIFYFRGHSSYLYKMQPGIYRKKELISNEDVIYKELLIRCPDDFEKLATTFETLVKMQHYSLPTRLLDLTSNPLVALYFACEKYEEDKQDGEVKILTIPRAEIKYYDSDTVTILANISRQPKVFHKNCIDDVASASYIRLMDDIKKERPYFQPEIRPESVDAVICVKPKLNNARIIKQDGAFLLFGVAGDKHNLATIPHRYTEQTENRRFLIDKASKKKIIEQLERIGISAATIYPEIDKVSNYISAKYGKPEELEEEPLVKE